MTLFKLPFSRRPPPPPPELEPDPIPVVFATTLSLDDWYHKSRAQSSRFVHKIELCTALCTGHDEWIDPIDEGHYHTLLRVSLGTRSHPGETLLIERVLDIWGAYHSVTPVSTTFLTTGTPFHPKVHDHICVISEGPSYVLAEDIEVERTLVLGDRAVTLAQFSRVLAFVSRATEIIRKGDRCRFHSRSFAFTCLAAFTPTLPPREMSDLEELIVVIRNGPEMVDDSELEFRAQGILGYVPGIIDPASMQALKMIAKFRKSTFASS